jgi:5-methyltetrahydrofolate--homocysteine methyltransferase
METRIISPKGKEVIIGDARPIAIIGERIHPFGKGPLKEAMKKGDMEPIRTEAVQQVEAGADMLMISTAAFGLDETEVLPRVARTVLEAVDVPLCLESRNETALEKALALGLGKPIVSSVTGEDGLLERILPVVLRHQTALIILASDASGIPAEAQRRVEIIGRIREKALAFGLKDTDLLADAVAESSAVHPQAARTTLETLQGIKKHWGLNLVLGVSNVSFGLPLRTVVNTVFLSLAARYGLNAAIVNAKAMKPYLLAADLLLGRDPQARRYTRYCRTLLQSTGPKTPRP